MQLREYSLTSLSQHSLFFSLLGQVGIGVIFREMGYVQVQNKTREVSVTAETRMLDNKSLVVFNIRGHNQVFIPCIIGFAQVFEMSDPPAYQARNIQLSNIRGHNQVFVFGITGLTKVSEAAIIEGHARMLEAAN